MSKRLLFTVLATIVLGMLFVQHTELLRLAYGVTTYFLEARFGTDDAAPLTDPHVSTGGQSVDVIDVEGVMDIGSGVLQLDPQASAVDGEEGLIYETDKDTYIGTATFFKIEPKVFGSTGSVSLGYAGGVDDVTNSVGADGLMIGTNVFQAKNYAQAEPGVISTLITIPTVDDTFWVAYLKGGFNNTATLTTHSIWYTGGGLTLSDFTEGAFIFIRKNDGNWILNNVNVEVRGSASDFPAITGYNADINVLDWLVLADGDSAYNPYINPLLYESGDHTSRSLYLHTPEKGAAFDSINGQTVISSNELVAPVAPSISTSEMNEDDVWGQVVTDIAEPTTGRAMYIVLRRDPSTGEHLLIGIETTAAQLKIYHFNGTSYAQRKAIGVTVASNTDDKIVLSAAVIGRAVYARYDEVGEFTTLTYTFSTDDSAGVGMTDHGIRIGDTTTACKDIRFYNMGNDGEFNSLTSFFTQSTGKRGKMILVQ